MKTCRRIGIILLLLSYPGQPVIGQSHEEQAVLAVTGAAELEDLETSEYERFEHFLRHPLRINLLSRSRLLASGLLTP